MIIKTDVYELYRVQCGLTLDGAAELVGVSARTLSRWRAGGWLPVAAFRLLSLYAGNLGALPGCDRWRGWRLVRGVLVSPEGEQITTGDLYSLPYLQRLAAVVRQQARERPAGRLHHLRLVWDADATTTTPQEAEA